jgi:hypothetical protein
MRSILLRSSCSVRLLCDITLRTISCLSFEIRSLKLTIEAAFSEMVQPFLARRLQHYKKSLTRQNFSRDRGSRPNSGLWCFLPRHPTTSMQTTPAASNLLWFDGCGFALDLYHLGPSLRFASPSRFWKIAEDPWPGSAPFCLGVRFFSSGWLPHWCFYLISEFTNIRSKPLRVTGKTAATWQTGLQWYPRPLFLLKRHGSIAWSAVITSLKGTRNCGTGLPTKKWRL